MISFLYMSRLYIVLSLHGGYSVQVSGERLIFTIFKETCTMNCACSRFFMYKRDMYKEEGGKEQTRPYEAGRNNE